MSNVQTNAAEYVRHGWALVPIADGSKGPTKAGWNRRERCITDIARAGDIGGNVGPGHAYSGTCAVDFDDLKRATAWLAERGIDAAGLLGAADAVQIDSGRENRAKLLFRLPEPLPSLKLAGNALELRCATRDGLTVQDVLPPSRHPVTGKPYNWKYNDDLTADWRELPMIPAELLKLWREHLQPETAPVAKSRDTTPADLARVRELLFAHDPSCGEQEWHRILMAVHWETRGSADGLELANEWSKAGKNYTGRAGIASRWRSWKLDVARPITLASLRREVVASAEDFEVVVAPPGERPLLDFKRDAKSGKILATNTNVYLALSRPDWSGMRIGKDVFRDEIMVAPVGTDDWRALIDDDMGQLVLDLERGGFRSVPREMLNLMLRTAASKNKFDSAMLWLESLRWDGEPRVERFLSQYGRAEDTPYTRAVSLYLWSALAGRVLSPGCQVDMVPIFVGGQGVRKSTSAEALVPAPEHFVEINLADRDTELSRKMRGKLVGEISELRGLSTRDLEAVKAWITTKHEEWTPKYQEFSRKYPRRLVLIGTTNADEFLQDETGNRRFLPCRVGAMDVERVAADRLQLWAEGAVLFRQSGVRWQDAERLAREEHGQYMVTDSWEELIRKWLDAADFEGGNDGGSPRRTRSFTSGDVLTDALNIPKSQVNRGADMRLARILKLMGFRQRRVGKHRARVWEPI